MTARLRVSGGMTVERITTKDIKSISSKRTYGFVTVVYFFRRRTLQLYSHFSTS